MALLPCLYVLPVGLLLTSWHPIAHAAGNDTPRVRLADGRYPNQGRVELFPSHADTWGSFCTNAHPHPVGRLVCRHFGYPAVYSTTAAGQFGQATGPIWAQAGFCNGDPSQEWRSPLACCHFLPWGPDYNGCDHRFDVGVTCFTGGLRLVGGRRESEGTVEVHVGGDDWVPLAYSWGAVLADTICLELGYPFAVGRGRGGPVDPSRRDTLCSYSSCPVGYTREMDFFSCIDDYPLKLCDTTVDGNNTLLEVVCATESTALPLDANLTYRLAPVDGGLSGSAGIIEASYNGSTWKTVCVDFFNEDRRNHLAINVCRDLGYPWSRLSHGIDWLSVSPGYQATGPDLVLRELVLDSVLGELRWVLGENSCRLHNYELVFVQCENGIVVNGLKVWPCSSQTCRDRCGQPAVDSMCGCDALCSLCGDCCYDYTEHCPAQNSSAVVLLGTLATDTVPFNCLIVNSIRSLVVNGCSAEFNGTETASLCSNDTSPFELIPYVDGIFFENDNCTQCNDIHIPTPSNTESSSDNDSFEPSYDTYSFDFFPMYHVHGFYTGINDCPPDTPEPIASACHSYASFIDTPNGKYKNLHCAYCNSYNISMWNYCAFHFASVLPVHVEVLVGREQFPWYPQPVVSSLEGDIVCYRTDHSLNVLPRGAGNSTPGISAQSSQVSADVSRCFLLTLGWQNIQLTWPLLISFWESEPTGAVAEVRTEYLSNVSDFTVLLDKTVLPSDQLGSSREWVVRCGVESVEFVETCGTTPVPEPCNGSQFVTSEKVLAGFNVSGVSAVYVGDGRLVESMLISFVRTYSYQADSQEYGNDTKVVVCGEHLDNDECQLPRVEETEAVTTPDGDSAFRYQGLLFLQDQVVYLADDRILICSEAFLSAGESFITYSDPLTILNIMGYSLSILALLVTLTNYCVFPVLRNVPGGAIMSLSAALLLAQLLTLTVLDKAGNHAFCVAMAALLHFLWLSTFTWSNALAFDLARTFASSQGPRSSKRTFLRYCLYGWGLPLLVVGVCMTISLVDGQRLGFQYVDDRSCWVVGKYAVIGAFLVPMACSLTVNAVLFGWTVHGVHASLVAAAMVHADKSKTKETLRELGIYFKISCVMGFTWLFGCLGRFVDHQAIWYIFVILNSLQGVFVFIAFGCSLRVRQLWRERLGLQKRSAGRKAPQKRSSCTSTSGVTNVTAPLSEATV